MRAPAFAIGDLTAHASGLLGKPGFREGVAEVADVADLPLDLAERDGPFRVEDSRDRPGVALVDHPLLLQRLELGVASRHLQVPQNRPVTIEPGPVRLERRERDGVLRGGQRPDGGVRKRRSQQLEGVEVDSREVPPDPGRDLSEIVAVEGCEHGLHVYDEAAVPALQLHEASVGLPHLRKVPGCAADLVMALSEMVERQPHGEGLPRVLSRLERPGDHGLDLLRDERVRRHRDVRGVVAAVEEARHFGQVVVQRGLSPRQDDAEKRRQIGESAIVVLERHFQVPVDVQVIPVEARHALRVAQVRHSEDQVPRQGASPLQPLGGEDQLVHRAATERSPRAIPVRSPAK